MRVLVATDQWFPDRMGGVARVATETARRWAVAGHEVIVLAPRSPAVAEPERDGGLLVSRVLPRGKIPQTLSDPIFTRSAANGLAGRHFDVMVAHNSTTAYGLLTSRVDAPLVYVFHADPVAESRFLRSTLPLRGRLPQLVLEQPLRMFGRSALRRAASIVVLSEFSRGLVAEVSPDASHKTQTVSGAVDTERFNPHGREESRVHLGIRPETTLVFTVRRHVPRMGLVQLVDAISTLADVVGLRLAIAGRGPLESELRARCNRLGLGSIVDFLGHVPDDDLPHWHRAADLFVLPTVAYEGFGLVTAEALASGTPVVGTPVGAIPELLTPLDTRLVAHATDAEALADAIRSGLTLATPELRRRSRAYAQQQLSWDVVMPAWERVLDDAVSAQRQRP
jgi:glycosyltransferase involved in cell wall biosynthesis